jgi:thioredoxin-like negative regulator of GroEL
MNTAADEVISLTQDAFEREVLHAQGFALVYFWRPDAPGDIRVARLDLLRFLAQWQGNIPPARVYEMNIMAFDDSKREEMYARFPLDIIPATFFFRDGLYIDQMLGAIPTYVNDQRLWQFFSYNATRK